MGDQVDFEMVLRKAVQVPLVGISREQFLRRELSLRYNPDTVEKAIQYCPAYAGIPVEQISPIADACISYETNHVSMISAAAGIPGGLAMAGTIPADMIQYTAHLLRIMQKLAYLYGWPEIDTQETDLDQETASLLTLFTGVMFGIEAANRAINSIAIHAAQQVAKKVARQALTKGTIYPIVKKVAVTLGFRMTKEIFAKSVSKIVPVVGAITSGTLTYATYRPMAYRLKDHLASLQIADLQYYGAKPVTPTGTVKNQSLEVMADQAIQNTGKAIVGAATAAAEGGAQITHFVGEQAKQAAGAAAPVVSAAIENTGQSLTEAGKAIDKAREVAGSAAADALNDAGKAIGGLFSSLTKH